MGLDARVAKVDKEGNILVCFADERLGNIAAVAEVREELSKYLSANSVMLSRVIYSGSHSGDCLDVGLVQKLHREMEGLPTNLTEATQEFLKGLFNIVKAALDHNLPIDF